MSVACVAVLAAAMVPAVADAAPYQAGRVVVRYRAGTTLAERTAVRRHADTPRQRAVGVSRAELVETAPGQSVADTVAELERDPRVLYAEPNYRFTATAIPNDARFAEQWALRAIRAPEAWDVTTGDSAVKVAVLDTGVSPDHPDLEPNLVHRSDGGGYDPNGHGTLVAGILGARGNDAAGVTGVDWRVSILPVAVLDERGQGTEDWIARGIDYAVQQGARIANMSFGGSHESQLIKDAITEAKDVLFVASAGNGADDHDGRLYNHLYPCDYTHDNVVCVGATDQTGQPASFSDWGRDSVDLFAPGVDVLSTAPHLDTLFHDDFEQPLNGRWTMSGPGASWGRTHDFAADGAWGLTEAASPDELLGVSSELKLAEPISIPAKAGLCAATFEAQSDLPPGEGLVFHILDLHGAFWYADAGPGRSRVTVPIYWPGSPPLEVGWSLARGLETPGSVSMDDVDFSCSSFEEPGDGYMALSGTSFAAPMVSGVAALRLAAHPGESVAELKAALLQSADVSPDLLDRSVSGGLLDAARAVTITPTITPPPPSGTISTAFTGGSPPSTLSADADGAPLYTTRSQVVRIRSDGSTEVVAGTGEAGFSGDGGPATQAQLNGPFDVAPTADGGLLITDRLNHRVREIDAHGVIRTVAGDGREARDGDGGPATAAAMRYPMAVLPRPDGSFLVSGGDADLRRVSASGTMSTVLMPSTDGKFEYAPGLPAGSVVALAGAPDGSVLAGVGGGYSDSPAYVGRLTSDDRFTRVAGSRTGFTGDGGPAIDARFGTVTDLSVRPDGSFLVADGANHRVRWVTTNGTIWTVAGGPNDGYSGDGGPALDARLGWLLGLIGTPTGFLVGETHGSDFDLREVDLPAGPRLPETTFSATPGEWDRAATATFAFASPAADASFECRLDGGAWAPCTSPQRLSDIAEGRHVFSARAVTAAGADDSPATWRWWRDTVPPDTQVDWPGDVFGGLHSSERGTFECRIDDQPWLACTSLVDAFGYRSIGPHRLAVRAVDLAGNVDPTPWTYDSYPTPTAAPEPVIFDGPAGTVNTADVHFDWGPRREDFTCELDGVLFHCKPPSTYRDLAPGPHTFRIWVDYRKGPSATRTWTYEPGGIDTTIASGPSGPVAATRATFAFFSPTSGARFECRLDAGEWNACAIPFIADGLADGPHTVAVRARTDDAVDASPATRRWIVDTTAPQTTIALGPASSTTARTARFDLRADEDAVRFDCRLDGGEWLPCQDTNVYEDLARGGHRFEARATDALGHTDPSPAVSTWTVGDGEAPRPPETTIDAHPRAITNESVATFSFSSDTPDASFECGVGGPAGVAYGPCHSPVTFDLAWGGTYYFYVRARGPDGTADPTPATFVVNFDTSGPWTYWGIADGPHGHTTAREASFDLWAWEDDVRFRCRLDEGDWEACSRTPRFTELALGDHRLEVRAYDLAGSEGNGTDHWSWTVMPEPPPGPPETYIDSGPPPTVSPYETPPVTFSALDPDATFECRVNDEDWAPCTSPTQGWRFNTTTLTFAVRAHTAQGTDPTPAERTWRVDGTAPTVTITDGPADPAPTGDATFRFTSDDPEATFRCTLDDGAGGPCTSPKSYTGLSPGRHRFHVAAMDGANNWSAAQRTWIAVRADPPDTTIESSPPLVSRSGGATFALGTAKQPASFEQPATFECRLDGGAWTTCDGSDVAYMDLADGSHVFSARAHTDDGGYDPTPAERRWTVDTAPPDTVIDERRGDTFTLHATETGAVLECRLDAGDWEACASPQTYSGLGAGEHRFEARARDLADNRDLTPAAATWTVTSSLPDTRIDSGPSGVVATSSATFAFSSPTAAATFECRVDDGAWSDCASPRTLSGLADGEHAFAVRARTAAGADPTPAERTWTVDTTPPDTVIDARDGDTLTFHATETGAAIQCRLDDGDWAACTSPKTYPALAPGEHRFEARSRDAAGNLDASPAVSTWTIDGPPDTAIDAGPGALTNSASATFTFSSATARATFECRLDDGAWSACTSPRTLSGVADGEHAFAVRARTTAGADPSPAQRTWTVDTTPPDTIIDARDGDSVTFHATDGGAAIQCRLDDGDWAACTSPKSYSALAPGDHHFEARAGDAAGNLDPTPATVSWTVAGVPDTSIDDGPAELAASPDATFSFSSPSPAATFECSLDGAAWAACASPRTLSGLADGEHAFAARARTSAGPDASPAERTWTIDTTVPTVTLHAGPETMSETATYVLEFDVDDADATTTCRLDEGPWAACASPIGFTGLGTGAHTVAVRAQDRAGNLSAPVTRDLTVVEARSPESAPPPLAPVVGAGLTTGEGSPPAAVPSIAASHGSTTPRSPVHRPLTVLDLHEVLRSGVRLRIDTRPVQGCSPCRVELTLRRVKSERGRAQVLARVQQRISAPGVVSLRARLPKSETRRLHHRRRFDVLATVRLIGRTGTYATTVQPIRLVRP